MRHLLLPAGLAIVAGIAGLVGLLVAHELRLAAVAILTAVGGAGALVAYAGWISARSEARSIAAGDDERIEELQADLESKLFEKQQALERERNGYKAMSEWNRELRRKIVELQHMHGALGDTSDTRAKILEVAIELLGAEKGVLLSREDLDGDGDLDMITAQGFKRDPEHTPIVQRFAREVIARDATVHKDDVDDPEIDNLVAIPIYIRNRFSGAVIACNKPGGFRDHDDEVLLALGDHAGAILQNAHLHGLLRSSYLTTVAMLADTAQAKDPFLRGHSDEVAKLVAKVADRFGFSPEERERLIFGSLLHDIGKIGISERILLKPAELTPEERDVIEMHPRIGHRLIERVPALQPIALAILHHHERWDGDGYPSELAGDDIPLEARIIAVADAFDAMTSDRPYRDRLTLHEACEELERCAGTQFDPSVVRAFVREVRRLPNAEDTFERIEPLRGFEFGTTNDEPVLGFGSFVLVDNLTLLYSHRHLHEIARLEAMRAQENQRPFALILVKLTEIDRINREQGYAAGDILLQRVARIVERAAGRCAGTGARLGGNCIALLVPSADSDIADRLAGEIARDATAVASVLVAFAVWRAGETGEELISRAQQRLSSASTRVA